MSDAQQAGAIATPKNARVVRVRWPSGGARLGLQVAQEEPQASGTLAHRP